MKTSREHGTECDRLALARRWAARGRLGVRFLRRSWRTQGETSPVRPHRDSRSPVAAAGFRPDIEGLRAIAVLLVVAYHAGVPGITGGYVGVDVFFVLSGYLITGLLTDEVYTTGRVDLASFYARRARRLLPALGLVLLATSALGFLVYAPFEQRVLADTAIATAFYVSNVWFAHLATDYLAADTHTNPLLHTWSLGVEEQFYLLWPLLVLAALRSRAADSDGQARMRRLRWTLAGVLVASFVCAVALTGVRQPWAFFLIPGRAWEFALGALGAAIANSSALRWFGPRGASMVGAALLATLAGVAFTFDAHTRFPGPFAAVPALATLGVLILGGAWPQGPLVYALSARPLQTLGRLSYGWYLWHWPVLAVGVAMAGPLSLGARVGLALVALALAELSYRLVEHPLRRHRHLALPSRALAMAGVVTLACLAAGEAWRQLALVWGNTPDQLRYTQAREDFTAIYRSGCHQDFSAVHVQPEDCATGPASAHRSVVLFGDSHAAQWYPAFHALAREYGWRLVPMTKYDCPAIDIPKYSKYLGRRYVECERWRDSALQAIERLQPDFTIVASSSEQPYTLAQWRVGADRVLARAAPASGEVVVLRDTPRPGFDVPTCLGRRAWMAGLLPRPDCRMDGAADADAPVFAALHEAAAGYRNARVLDLTDVICPAGRCTPDPEGWPAYRDTDHLSATYVRTLAPILAGRLGVAGPSPPSERAGLMSVQIENRDASAAPRDVMLDE
jgi:peptidoglycan/LPS O-acetylase OafA/YrhL